MWHTDCFLINALPIEERFIFYFKHHETKKKNSLLFGGKMNITYNTFDSTEDIRYSLSVEASNL